MDTRIGEIVFEFNEAGTKQREELVLAGAREAGYTLDELGQMFGVTRERIRQRVARVPAGAALPVFPPSARKVQRDARAAEKLAKQRSARAAQRRILGLRMDSPVMNVPVETLNEICRLSELVTTVRGWTPLDDPARLAITPYGDLLHETITKYEIPQRSLDLPFGKAGGTFTAWLRNHGYMKQMPSQKSYKGVLLEPGRRKGSKTLVVGGVCKGGHVMTEENIVANGTTGNVTCRLCRNERRKLAYRRKREAISV